MAYEVAAENLSILRIRQSSHCVRLVAGQLSGLRKMKRMPSVLTSILISASVPSSSYLIRNLNGLGQVYSSRSRLLTPVMPPTAATLIQRGDSAWDRSHGWWPSLYGCPSDFSYVDKRYRLVIQGMAQVVRPGSVLAWYYVAIAFD